MPLPLGFVKIQCSNCKLIDFFHARSDVILGFPKCKKCGTIMQVVGEVTLLNWVTHPKSWFK